MERRQLRLRTFTGLDRRRKPVRALVNVSSLQSATAAAAAAAATAATNDNNSIWGRFRHRRRLRRNHIVADRSIPRRDYDHRVGEVRRRNKRK